MIADKPEEKDAGAALWNAWRNGRHGRHGWNGFWQMIFSKILFQINNIVYNNI